MRNKILAIMIVVPVALCISLRGCEKEPCCCEDSPVKAKEQHIVLKQDTLFFHTTDENGKTIRVTKVYKLPAQRQ